MTIDPDFKYKNDVRQAGVTDYLTSLPSPKNILQKIKSLTKKK